jgi:nucleotide-binding universal stress UspA family protein
MPGLILVPLDGSSLAGRALPYATALARERQLPLLLVRVLEASPSRGMPLVQEPEARSYLEHVAVQLREAGIAVQTDVSSTLFGTVAEVLVSKAQQRGCELIVMSTHGRGGLGRWVYGTVAEEVLRRSPVPVLLISSTCERAWAPGKRLRVLLPLDGSRLSEEVVEPMLTSIGRLASEIVVLQVEPSSSLPDVFLSDGTETVRFGDEYLNQVARLRKEGLNVTALTEEGSPGAVISRVAAEQDVDLIAMATHGRTGMARLVLGSVSTETLHRSHVPVLLYRPAAMRREPAPGNIDSAEPQVGNNERLTVLVAIDMSDKANAALAPAAMLARAANARVILLNVLWPSVDMGHVTAGTQEERIEYVQRERQLYLAEKARMLEGFDVTTRVEVQADGEEVDECIARVVSEVHADVLVVVSKHVSGGASAVFGSFAQGILRLSSCPVLVVRPGSESRRLPELEAAELPRPRGSSRN